MRTEELLRREKPRDVYGVSPALLDLGPPDWQLRTSQGKRVPLSAAGYVLHFGHAYQIRLATLEDGPPFELRLVSVPSFVSRLPGTEPGCVAFQVRREGWQWLFKGPANLHCDAIQLECICGEGADRRRVEFTIPVVARIRWSVGIVCLLVFWAFLWLVYGQLQSLGKSLITSGAWQTDGLGEWWASQHLIEGLGWLVLIAALYPLGALVWHVYQLRQRRAELEASYRQRFHPGN
jgi:hypothetical protein